ERGAEAEVVAEAEGEMALRRARHVEAFPVRELRFVAVRGAVQREDDRALRDLDARKLDVLERPAREELDRTVVPERLLDERGDPPRLALHQRELTGAGEEGATLVA